MNDDQWKCIMDAQDNLQTAKAHVNDLAQCLAGLHKFNDDPKKAKQIMEGQEVVHRLQARLDRDHISLMGLLEAFDEVMAGEASKRR